MLEKLDFFANALTGTIPDSLEKLRGLIFIDLQENLLTGPAFPSSLLRLGDLHGYRVNGNALTGSIPTQVVALQNLEQLWMADNEIAGTFPSELGSLRNLKSLFLFDNSLLGSLPSEVGLLPLEDMRLNGNFFQGSIPTQLFNVGSLRSIRLDRNFFLGEIPPVLGQLTNLIDLRVNSNNLSGEIPSEIGLLTNLGKSGWPSTCAPEKFSNNVPPFRILAFERKLLAVNHPRRFLQVSKARFLRHLQHHGIWDNSCNIIFRIYASHCIYVKLFAVRQDSYHIR